MRRESFVTWMAGALAAGLTWWAGPATGETYFLPSSAWGSGANGAVYRTNVWLLNPGEDFVTVKARFEDVETHSSFDSREIRIGGRTQAIFENVHDSMLARFPPGHPPPIVTYGPIRFDSTGPLIVTASVVNVNACGSGAAAGQVLPALEMSEALLAGVIGQLAVSADPSSGYRTNLVLVNPGHLPATATIRVRSGGGALLASAEIGLYGIQFGFNQIALGSLPGMAGVTDTDLWLEFSSDQPVIAYATVIHNVSGDPFAVMATPDPAPLGPNEIAFLLPGEVPLIMVKIPAGTFQMGSPPGEPGRVNSYELLHPVTLTSDYWIGKYEVTRAQWRAVMGSDPSELECPGDCPVDSVSWEDIRGPDGFLSKLNALLGTTKFRLPTEAEWERAARGGTQTRFFFGDALGGSGYLEARPYVWYTNTRSLPVGTKLPNPFGLHDVHGNMHEWVEDWLAPYTMTAQTDPTGPVKGTVKVLRGGSFSSYDLKYVRSASRWSRVPNAAPDDFGFRLAMSP